MTRLRLLNCAFVVILFSHDPASAQPAPPLVTDIAGIEIGAPRGSAEPILHALGCSLAAEIAIDDTDALRLVDRFHVETVREFLRWQKRVPLLDGVPSLLDQVYRCRENQLILMSIEHDPPKRIGALTLAYCSVDEEAGAQPIYDKVGSRKMALGDPKFGPFDIFFPKAVSGDRLQQTAGRLSMRFPDTVHAVAFKKPDGCIIDHRPGGYLYALSMSSRKVVGIAIDRSRKFRQRKIDSMKVAPRL